jgi:hypothetical protein
MQLLATTTWNSSDIIGTFLEYYRRLGVDRVLLMDFDSTDQTQEIARSFGDFVSMVPYPGIANLDSSNIMLALARERFGPDARCLFCDPDEFLVVPDGVGAGQLGLHSARGISIPRHNVTARVSDVLERPDELTPIGCLNLRIDRRAVRNVPQDMFLDELTPPWIYTAIPGKVSVRLGSATAIGAGDHGATFTNSEATVSEIWRISGEDPPEQDRLCEQRAFASQLGLANPSLATHRRRRTAEGRIFAPVRAG